MARCPARSNESATGECHACNFPNYGSAVKATSLYNPEAQRYVYGVLYTNEPAATEPEAHCLNMKEVRQRCAPVQGREVRHAPRCQVFAEEAHR